MVKTGSSTHRHSLVKMTDELPTLQGAVMEGSDSEEEETVEGTAAEAANTHASDARTTLPRPVSGATPATCGCIPNASASLKNYTAS